MLFKGKPVELNKDESIIFTKERLSERTFDNFIEQHKQSTQPDASGYRCILENEDSFVLYLNATDKAKIKYFIAQTWAYHNPNNKNSLCFPKSELGYIVDENNRVKPWTEDARKVDSFFAVAHCQGFMPEIPFELEPKRYFINKAITPVIHKDQTRELELGER